MVSMTHLITLRQSLCLFHKDKVLVERCTDLCKIVSLKVTDKDDKGIVYQFCILFYLLLYSAVGTFWCSGSHLLCLLSICASFLQPFIDKKITGVMSARDYLLEHIPYIQHTEMIVKYDVIDPKPFTTAFLRAITHRGFKTAKETQRAAKFRDQPGETYSNNDYNYLATDDKQHLGSIETIKAVEEAIEEDRNASKATKRGILNNTKTSSTIDNKQERKFLSQVSINIPIIDPKSTTIMEIESSIRNYNKNIGIGIMPDAPLFNVIKYLISQINPSINETSELYDLYLKSSKNIQELKNSIGTLKNQIDMMNKVEDMIPTTQHKKLWKIIVYHFIKPLHILTYKINTTGKSFDANDHKLLSNLRSILQQQFTSLTSNFGLTPCPDLRSYYIYKNILNKNNHEYQHLHSFVLLKHSSQIPVNCFTPTSSSNFNTPTKSKESNTEVEQIEQGKVDDNEDEDDDTTKPIDMYEKMKPIDVSEEMKRYLSLTEDDLQKAQFSSLQQCVSRLYMNSCIASFFITLYELTNRSKRNKINPLVLSVINHRIGYLPLSYGTKFDVSSSQGESMNNLVKQIMATKSSRGVVGLAETVVTTSNQLSQRLDYNSYELRNSLINEYKRKCTQSERERNLNPLFEDDCLPHIMKPTSQVSSLLSLHDMMTILPERHHNARLNSILNSRIVNFYSHTNKLSGNMFIVGVSINNIVTSCNCVIQNAKKSCYIIPRKTMQKKCVHVLDVVSFITNKDKRASERYDPIYPSKVIQLQFIHHNSISFFNAYLSRFVKTFEDYYKDDNTTTTTTTTTTQNNSNSMGD